MQRTIKSFVIRAGRISKRQQFALDNWLEQYSLPKVEGGLNLKTVFGQERETIVEIGFGMGHSLIQMAESNPHKNFIGIEVHRAGVGSLVADAHDKNLTNIRIV